MKKLTLTILLLLLTSAIQAQVTTLGTEFWLSFMDSNTSSQDPKVVISATDTTEVQLSNKSGVFKTITVYPDQVVEYAVGQEYLVRSEGLSTGSGFRIRSDLPIRVWALGGSYAAEMGSLLPVSSLGNNYLVMGYKDTLDSYRSRDTETSALIVSASDGTQVEIVPSDNTVGGLIAGDTTIITLDKWETYYIRAVGDLSGTSIRSLDNNECGRIAVFSGSRNAGYGICYDPTNNRNGLGQLLEQMLPIENWGTEFLYVPFNKELEEDIVKVVASEDGTEVEVSGEPLLTLNIGEHHTYVFLNGARNIKSNKPIMVGQVSRFLGCESMNSPAFLLLQPREHRIYSSFFKPPYISDGSLLSTEEYYLHLVSPSEEVEEVYLDGRQLDAAFTRVGDMSYLNLAISQSEHLLTSKNGVTAYVYGHSNKNSGPLSYAFSAGIDLEDIHLAISAEDGFIGTVSDQACLNSDILFEATFDIAVSEGVPRYNTFTWDFGDGGQGTGEQSTHRYTEPGVYEVRLYASDGRGDCGFSELAFKTIEILDTEVDELQGPTSVCPEVTGVAYSISGAEDNTYQWFVEGGSINGPAEGDTIFVDWGLSNQDALVKVVGYNYLGCPSDTLTLPVTVNRRLEPAPPKRRGGEAATVCYSERESVIYYTDPTNGSSYEWFVDDHGEILGSNSGNSVEVRWSGTGQGNIWYKESNSAISDCEGISDTLEVVVYPAIEVAENIEDISCNGSSDGSITLSVTGGSGGTYTAMWDNGMEGLSVANLPPGSYAATVSDGVGCSVTVTYEVLEPKVLSIGDISVQSSLCFGEGNGTATVVVDGGSPHADGTYSYLWEGEGRSFTTTTHFVTDLTAGDYTVTVIDDNQCEAKGEFRIEDTNLLEADLSSLINDPICPGSTDGTAYIDAKGGTPDYQFYWSNNPEEDNPQASNLSKGTYTVVIVDANGCETSLEVEVSERNPKLFIPNAFSPNGDGENDSFQPVADCALKYSMQLYNKWGSVVFSTEQIGEGWDGTVNGEPAPLGSYSYVIFYAGSLNGITYEQTYRGKVRLIR